MLAIKPCIRTLKMSIMIKMAFCNNSKCNNKQLKMDRTINTKMRMLKCNSLTNIQKQTPILTGKLINSSRYYSNSNLRPTNLTAAVSCLQKIKILEQPSMKTKKREQNQRNGRIDLTMHTNQKKTTEHGRVRDVLILILLVNRSSVQSMKVYLN